jgi:large subunit ribosomal protein L30
VAKLSIKWVKSGIGYPKDQRDTLKALGLRRINHVVEQENTQVILGMINKVKHLVTVEENEDGSK